MAATEWVSPRISALGSDVEAGARAVLDAFWEERAQAHGPLIEPLESDEDHSLVTFVWRDDAAQSVALVTSLNQARPASGVMSRLLDTDLWYRTERIRNDALISYHFFPDDPLTAWEEIGSEEGTRDLLARLRPDPLNPDRLDIAIGDVESEPAPPHFVTSTLAMPAAPPRPFAAPRPGVPSGTVHHHRLASAILENERSIWVYTPPGYVLDGPLCALLVLFDGGVYVGPLQATVTLDNLLAEGRIPPLICVFVDHPDLAARQAELACNDRFADCLIDELLPWVGDRYAITDEPTRSVVAGSSRGGSTAMFMGYRHPERFGKLLCQSGVYFLGPGERPDMAGWLISRFVESPRLPLTIYMDIGVYEDFIIFQATTRLGTNRHMRDVLLAKAYPLRYVEFAGGHDYLWWQATLADGLIHLLGSQEGTPE